MSAGKKENSLSLVLRLVDKATGPLKAFGHTLKALNEPGNRLSKALHEIGEQSGLFRVGEALKGVGEGFRNVGEKVLDLGKEIALMAIEAGFVAYEVISHFVEIGDQLKKTSERLGLTVDGWAELVYVGKRAGLTTEELTTDFDKFNKGLGEAHVGTGSLLKALERTPAAFKKQILGAKTTEAALDLMFAAFEKIEDPATKAAFATEFFGKSGAKMVNFVKGGPGEIKKLRAEYHRIAGSQKEFAESAEVLQDAMEDVKAAFMGLGAAAMTELFPALTDLAGVLKEFLVENRDGIRVWARDTARAITDWVKGGGIERLVASFKNFMATVNPIVESVGGWPTVLAAVAAAITAGPLLGALASLAVAFGTLGVAILATPLGWALGLLALVAGAAAFALAKDEALHQRDMRRLKALGDQKAAQDAVTDAQEDLNEALKRGSATESEINQKREILNANKKWAADAYKETINAQHDMPGFKKDAPTSWGIDVTDALGKSPMTKVVVDFNNTPKGTKITTAPGSTADVDLNTGVNMAGANP